MKMHAGSRAGACMHVRTGLGTRNGVQVMMHTRSWCI